MYFEIWLWIWIWNMNIKRKYKFRCFFWNMNKIWISKENINLDFVFCNMNKICECHKTAQMFCSTYFGNNLAGKLQERNSVWQAGYWSRAKWSKHCLGPQHQPYCKFLSFLFSCVGFWPRNWTMLSLWGHRRRKIQYQCTK